MDFEAVMKTLGHYVSSPKIREVLSVVRNNDSRRFQVKVAQPDLPGATWKGLPWKVVAIRAVLGHNRAVVENAKISSLVKKVFTLEPLLKKEDLDGAKLPRTNLRPDLVPEMMQRSCRESFTTVVTASRWRRSLSMESSREDGHRERGERTIFALPRTPGMTSLEGRSSRKRQPESSIT